MYVPRPGTMFLAECYNEKGKWQDSVEGPVVCWVSRDESLPSSPVELQSTSSSLPWIVWFKDGGLEMWQLFCAVWENPRAGGGCRAANTEWSLKRKSTHQRTDPLFHEMIYLGWGCWVPGSVLAWETPSCPSSS